MNANRTIDLIIKNIDVLSMVDSTIARNRSIFIREGRITAIADGLDDQQPATRIIDGKDKYIMPGLVNMHTHLGDNAADLLLYLVNGITTIRNMWGYEGFRFGQWMFGTRVFNHLRLKKQIEEGKVAGPRIYTDGPLLDGNPPVFPKFMYLHTIEEEKQIERIIKEQSDKGYDFIKIYSALSKENFDTIIDVARRYEIPVAGHVPDSVSIHHALESKLHSIEHLTGFINAYKPEQNVQREKINKLAALAAANNVWNCPTLVANERLSNIERQQEYENEEQMDYVSPKNKRAMRYLLKTSDKLFRKKGIKGNHHYMDEFLYIIRQLKTEGAGILLGTDKGTPYIVAGFSEHAEMKLLNEAGLNTCEVLQAATVNAARCLKKENDFGTIETGKKADLIITQNNPLHNLDTIRHHIGVIKSGVYYSRETCDRFLRELKKKASRQVM